MLAHLSVHLLLNSSSTGTADLILFEFYLEGYIEPEKWL